MYAHLRSGRRGRSRFGACLEGSRHPRRRRLFPIGGRPLGSPRIGAERASVLAIKPGQSRSRQPRRQAAPPPPMGGLRLVEGGTGRERFIGI